MELIDLTDQFVAEFRTLERQQTEREEEISRLATQLETTESGRSEESAAELVALRDELARTRDELAACQQALQEKDEQAAVSRSTLDVIDKQDKSLSELRAEITLLKEEHLRLVQEKSELKKQTGLLPPDWERIQTKYKRQHADLIRLREENRSLKSDNEGLRRENFRLARH